MFFTKIHAFQQLKGRFKNFITDQCKKTDGDNF